MEQNAILIQLFLLVFMVRLLRGRAPVNIQTENGFDQQRLICLASPRNYQSR